MRSLGLFLILSLLTSCFGPSDEFLKHQAVYYTTTYQYTVVGIEADTTIDEETKQLLLDVVKSQEISLRTAGAFELVEEGK